jgi:Co/Zn/Cd efflux system component
VGVLGNDIASNTAVFIAAGAVWLTDSGWPDIVVGLALAALFLRSAGRVTRDALRALRADTSPTFLRRVS